MTSIRPGDEEPAGGQERRRYFRLPRRSLVRHKRLEFSPEPSRAEAGRMRDLSLSGVRFDAEGTYAIGDLLRLELDLPGWEKERIDFYRDEEAVKPLVVLAEVRWVKPVQDRFEVGALFVNVDRWHWKALDRYLSKLQEKEGEEE